MTADLDGKSEDTLEPWERHWERFAASNRVNPGPAYRRRLIHHLLGAEAAGPGAAILDIGCGPSDLLAELAERYPQAAIAGVDLSRSGLALARGKLPRALLVQSDFAAAAPEELHGWASHAVCSEVLEHVDDPAGLLAAAAACLRPGGRLVVTVPGGPMSAFDRHLGHRRHYTRSRLAGLLEEADFRLDLAVAAGFPMRVISPTGQERGAPAPSFRCVPLAAYKPAAPAPKGPMARNTMTDTLTKTRAGPASRAVTAPSTRAMRSARTMLRNRPA